MKNRRLYIAAVAILFLGLLGWWAGRQSAQAAASANPPAPPVVKIDQSIPDADKMQMILNAQNGRQIDFYGKVVDQNGQPVVGAKIRGNILVTGFEGTASHDNYVNTDASGLFRFTGLHGAQFWVTPSKDGYAYTLNRAANWSEDYKPDPANPLVFTMYKLQGAEPMVHLQLIQAGVPCDGTEISFNLLTGKKNDSIKDFVVKFERNPVEIDRGKPFDWTLTLQISDGGLSEVMDSYPYLAPENGYRQSTTIDMPAGKTPNWSPSFDKLYYFKVRNGQIFGRIEIHLMANYTGPTTHFEFELYANPSGSRNLEFDPAKTVKSGSVGVH